MKRNELEHQVILMNETLKTIEIIEEPERRRKCRPGYLCSSVGEITADLDVHVFDVLAVGGSGSSQGTYSQPGRSLKLIASFDWLEPSFYR